MRVRFAPSPTGHLHVGNARTALFNWLLARGSGGTFILRIEDTDRERSTSASEQAILEDLEWLGLEWDEGPGVGGDRGPYRQSERLDIYRAQADRLLAEGRAYYCFCPEAQLKAEREAALAAGEAPKYSGRCRSLSPSEVAARRSRGEPAAVRFRVPEGGDVAFLDGVRGLVSFPRATIGDFVLLRSDGNPAYNFAVVVDDALMEVTQVVRGEDHISNTPRQVLLYEALGYRAPRFAHVALVMGPDHTPLSKRHGATSVAEFRARGYLPEALLNYLALIGWSPGGDQEVLPIDELARRFRLEDVGRSAGVFDEEKLAWVNRHYMRLAGASRLARLAAPFLRAEGIVVTEPDAGGWAYLESVVVMASDSVDRLADIPGRLRFLFSYDAARALARPEVQAIVNEDGAREVVRCLAHELAASERLTSREAFRAAADRVKRETGRKGKALFHPIRVALTGEAGGPELDHAVPAIERGADLPASSGLAPIAGCGERVRMFLDALDRA
ncbi:MAG TPA: glutamate--tRNA ligase [Vicinamibacterales bacterium]|nr:glutamate--tRNA ligase [Acidobacteriota bacterium]HOC19546.1 glutamate--tRNA ligase [Vicinamibacterales bacterium]